MNQGRKHEFQTKVERVRTLLSATGLGGVYLKSQANFSWLSCGGENYVGLASTIGSGGLLVTAREVHLVANRIEADRLMNEEVRGLPVRAHDFPWQNPEEEAKAVQKLVGKKKVGSDCGLPGSRDVAGKVKPLRASLHPLEVRRYRSLGRDAEEAIRTVAASLQPGMTESEITGRLAEEAFSRGMQPVTLLIAGDERISRYRHPIPKKRLCRRRVMLVLCARRGGLIVSLTRLVAFGRVTRTLERRHEAVTRIDTMLIQKSKPGTRYGSIFTQLMEAYTSEGFEGEWNLHHQGGPTGYEARDFKVTAKTRERVQENQAIAWNPSITGTKSEDTIVVSEKGFEILTEAKEWPMVTAETEWGTVERPDILRM